MGTIQDVVVAIELYEKKIIEQEDLKNIVKEYFFGAYGVEFNDSVDKNLENPR